MPAANDPDRICTIRIELTRSEPLIWREVEVPTAITLDDLHDVIQIAMGWHNEHMFEFTVGKQTYCPQDEYTQAFGRSLDSGVTLLSDVLRPRRTKIRYLYDFGDSWVHTVIVTRIRAAEAGVAYPRYIGGERNGPPEDCGGLYGFYEGLESVSQRGAADEENDEYGDFEGWAESFKPDHVDVEKIEARLRGMAEHFSAPKPPPRNQSKATGPVHAALGNDPASDPRIRLMIDAPRSATPRRPRSASRK